MQATSRDRSTYLINFIDDFNCRTWVYFLKNKFEAFDKFLDFKAQSKKQSGDCIKLLRSNRGREYISNIFVNFCRENGIWKELIASYSPQQNGVAERKNRTIIDTTRSMLKETCLPTKY